MDIPAVTTFSIFDVPGGIKNFSSYILTLVRILEVLGPFLRCVLCQSVSQSVCDVQVLFYFFLGMWVA